MKVFVLFIALLVVVECDYVSMMTKPEDNISQLQTCVELPDILEEFYTAYCKYYSKSYSMEEKVERRSYFKLSIQKIIKRSSASTEYLQALNRFADWSEEEIAGSNGAVVPGGLPNVG